MTADPRPGRASVRHARSGSGIVEGLAHTRRTTTLQRPVSPRETVVRRWASIQKWPERLRARQQADRSQELMTRKGKVEIAGVRPILGLVVSEEAERA